MVARRSGHVTGARSWKYSQAHWEDPRSADRSHKAALTVGYINNRDMCGHMWG